MGKGIIWAALITLSITAGCATTPPKEEGLAWSLPAGETNWVTGNEREVKGKYRIYEYVREGESIQDWSELLTIQNFAGTKGSPEEILDVLKALREKQCPGATSWNVIAKDEGSILYEWKAKRCAGWPDQHEIARIVDGKWNRWRFAYTAKVPEIAKERREIWIQSLSEARIEEKQQ